MSDNVISNPQMTKREFMRFCGMNLCMFSAASLFGLPKISLAQSAKKGLIKTKLSPYFTSLEGGEIQCELCPHRCRVPRGKRGICRVRENRDGKYYSLVYGNPCAIHLDPIEKKPLFHVLPGTVLFHSLQRDVIYNVNFARIGRSHRHSQRMYTVTMSRRR